MHVAPTALIDAILLKYDSGSCGAFCVVDANPFSVLYKACVQGYLLIFNVGGKNNDEKKK